MKLGVTERRRDAQPWLEDITGAAFTKAKWYGTSLALGLLHIHDAESGPTATDELHEAFADEADGLQVIATDWLGQHYAVGKTADGVLVVRADIASAQLGAIGTLEQFLTTLLKDRKAPEFFDNNSFRAVKNHFGLKSMPFDQCASYKVPPFLGGKPALDNFDIVLTTVHWSLFGQLYQQAKGLPDGTPISEITPAD